ncbi:DUF1489 family protein [Saccharibacter floricola]|uniref:DUF1489 family protein n=1 Tax=Saccharibacter floricola DSM 15669 TaxID=1123227 RepID=A0ABQ0NXU7_9PROT|nr:DUF1489 domain-containing protein [Saccharibacter floricola]GBQ06098.1 hypothetical protein AA15669_0783 [Saccharibacter floricola DSM 15669]
MLHMIKLAVGCASPDILREWTKTERINGHVYVQTRTKPKRTAEILDGGSIYRVMNGLITCRQPVIGFDHYTRPDGHQGTLILVSDDVIAVQPRPMRPFQGWRYLKPEDAPADLKGGQQHNDGTANLPPTLRARLTELGLL